MPVDPQILTFKSVDETRAVFSCGTVYYAVQGGSQTFWSVDETLVCDHSNESY